MKIDSFEFTNWRNFKSASARLSSDITYILGPNASGKSNLLDAIRFMRDITKKTNGGLQTALEKRGGLSKVRCLFARGSGGANSKSKTDVGLCFELSDESDVWKYEIRLNFPRSGNRNMPMVKEEIVTKNGDVLLNRKADDAIEDEEELQATLLEQPASNKPFREISDFFSETTYVHVVPQLLKHGEQIGGKVLDDDPFGQAFMLRITNANKKTRESRLKKIGAALSTIVPGLSALEYHLDNMGIPHIQMRYDTFRQHPAKQLEDQMSDGTLRLIALLWLLMENRTAPLLLEEPELSLNEQIVAKLHALFSKATRSHSPSYQILVSTHSYALLKNPGIDPTGILLVNPTKEGSSLASPSRAAMTAMKNGIPPADVVLQTNRQFELEI